LLPHPIAEFASLILGVASISWLAFGVRTLLVRQKAFELMHLFISNYEIFFVFLAVKLMLERELTILLNYRCERNGRRTGSLILDIRYLDSCHALVFGFQQQHRLVSFEPLLRPFRSLLYVQISDT
jgi:hypothetical protein